MNHDNLNNNSLTEIREPSNLFTFSPKEGFDIHGNNENCDFSSKQKNENLENKPSRERSNEFGNNPFENNKVDNENNLNGGFKLKGSFNKIKSLEVIVYF